MICEICFTRPVEHSHHLLSQSKMYRKIYGKLLDEPFNRMDVCSVCHLNKNIPKFTELEFRKTAEYLNYKLPEPSKTLKAKGNYASNI
jgi:hypothetical protein